MINILWIKTCPLRLSIGLMATSTWNAAFEASTVSSLIFRKSHFRRTRLFPVSLSHRCNWRLDAMNGCSRPIDRYRRSDACGFRWHPNTIARLNEMNRCDLRCALRLMEYRMELWSVDHPLFVRNCLAECGTLIGLKLQTINGRLLACCIREINGRLL